MIIQVIMFIIEISSNYLMIQGKKQNNRYRRQNWYRDCSLEERKQRTLLTIG